MAGRSKSRQSSNVEQQLANVSNVAGSVVTGKGNVVTFSDQGAVQAGVDMFSTGAAFLEETNATALGLVEDVTYQSHELSELVVEQAGENIYEIGRIYDTAFDALADAYVTVGQRQQETSEVAVTEIGQAYQSAVSNVGSAYRAATQSFDMQKTLLYGGVILGVLFIASRVIK